MNIAYKPIAALLIGVLLGAAATYSYLPSGPGARFSEVPERDIQSVPEVSLAEAELHRADRYASIRTIEDTLALPTDFAETEALYVIAGRADSEEVQNLIHQAARIQERNDRKAALGILFLRLTELDPDSALAIARTPTFRSDESYERSVWVAWGRLDLDAALAAAAEGSPAQKNLAAQALYSSLRDPGDRKSAQIRTALGVAPGRGARAQRLYALADESPAAAIRYIESLTSRNEQSEQYGWLAQYLSRTGRIADGNLEELIQSAANRQIFRQSVMMHGARRDPEAALQQFLAAPMNSRTQNQAYMAFQQLAQQDPEKALNYLDKLPPGQSRQAFVSIVAGALAGSDPSKALDWARRNDSSSSRMALISVLSQIAQNDPQLALAEAQAIKNPQVRDQAISNVLMMAAQADPSIAAQVLETVTNTELRRSIIGQLGSNWASTDFEAAVAWASSLQSDDKQMALTAMVQTLVHNDVDQAINLLDRFALNDSGRLRAQIAQNLVHQRSIDAAQAFIAQYKGTEDYDRLQVSVLSAAASADPARAMQLAKTVADPRSRDKLYASIIGQRAASDPQQALQWMESISSPAARTQAITQIAYSWYSRDAAAAEAWLRSLPRGAARDDAIAATTSMRRDASAETRDLIESIGDAGKRKQAMLMLVQRISRSNPAEAERLFREIDMSDAEREQYRQILERSRYDDFGFAY